MQNFLPHTPADRETMLRAIGVTHVESLFEDIPAAIRQRVRHSVLPERGLSEQELQTQLASLAAMNTGASMACFIGGGAYARFIPMAVHSIAGRSEFYTAYTPYQPEISQGTLQVTYEFQTMISELTGMDVANASVYDGANALTEAALMAMRATRRDRVLIASSVHPDYRSVLATYLTGVEGSQCITFDPLQPGNALDAALPEAKQAACVIVQIPNFWGGLEATAPIREFCRATGALFVVSAEPVSLGLLQPPGEYGADIVTGDIQPLGNHLSFGGPYGGYIATRSAYMRQLPGRLVGRTRDKNGKLCYTLTLQTREQHIRREKATSNICTNQALNILKATVYLSLVGPSGLRHLANLSVQRAHDLATRLRKLPDVTLYKQGQPFAFEFALRFPVSVDALLAQLEKLGILGGIALERFDSAAKNVLLITCTELTRPEDLDRYEKAVRNFMAAHYPQGFNQPAYDTSPREATC